MDPNVVAERAARAKELTRRTCLALTCISCGAWMFGCGTSPSESSCNGEPEALRVCAPGATVKGMDVSTYQGQVDWASAKKAGVAFAFARVSDGLTHPDDQFTRNWQTMKANGIVRGAYQFFRPEEDPAQQAALFVKNVGAAGGLGKGDLPAVLDVEVTDSVTNAALQANVTAWLAYVEKATGKRPLVYTALFMSPSLGAGFGAYPLWVANYGATCPTMPDGWSAWKFWQDSSTGTVSGVAGQVDLDEFNGTMADLIAFAGAGGDAGTTSDAGSTAPGPPGADGGGGAGANDAGAANTGSDAGATVGSGTPPATGAADSGAAPCAPSR